MIIHVIIDEMIHITLIEVSFMNIIRPISCKTTINNLRYALYAKIVHNKDNRFFKNA